MIDCKQYVVFDVETNGLSSERDDLLSISIYKPDDHKIYNKFFPLEKSKIVRTTHYNGITTDMLKDATPLTQTELDEIVEEFDIKNRIVLTFGEIDKRFFRSYLKRKNLKGFDLFDFFDFKSNIFSSSFQNGNITKDNLCNLYGIDNVQKVHSGINDCILEWKLFEKMNGNQLIVINDKVYEYNENYILPVSYITYCNRLKKKMTLPRVAATLTPIYRYNLADARLVHFSFNISGLAIEHVINSVLKVDTIDSSKVLLQNFAKLKYIGTLPAIGDRILLKKEEDGKFSALENDHQSIVALINKTSASLKEHMYEFLQQIKHDVFKDERIFSQEPVINQEYNLLALCDLSNKHAVVEIKTAHEIDVNDFALQLYIQSKERPVYLLYIDWINKSVNLGKIEFFFGENTTEIIAENKRIKATNERNRLQRIHFEKKDLDLTFYKGKTCISEFRCRKCKNNFKMKSPLTYDRCYYLVCPYCNPSSAPRFDNMKDNSPNGAKELYWRSKNLKNITIKNWILKDQIYAKCKACAYEWCDEISNILKDKCPKCNSSKN